MGLFLFEIGGLFVILFLLRFILNDKDDFMSKFVVDEKTRKEVFIKIPKADDIEEK
jgi:hypothetical protein